MKKLLSLVLTLCMLLTAFPVFAEAAEDEGSSGVEGILSLISDLKDKFTGSDAELSIILSGLKGKLQDLLESGDERIGSVLSGLKEKFSGGSDFDLDGFLSGVTEKLSGGSGSDVVDKLLGSLFGGGDEAEDTGDEDDLDLEETIAMLNEQAEAEFGDDIPGKRNDAAIEEFYGYWVYSKFVFDGTDYDVSGDDAGVFIGENTYYSTQNGEKSPDYMHPETAEMKFEKGALKILIGDIWDVFVLTEAGELVQAGGSLQTYYVPAGE